jgi:hypothetical protein
MSGASRAGKAVTTIAASSCSSSSITKDASARTGPYLPARQERDFFEGVAQIFALVIDRAAIALVEQLAEGCALSRVTRAQQAQAARGLA